MTERERLERKRAIRGSWAMKLFSLLTSLVCCRTSDPALDKARFSDPIRTLQHLQEAVAHRDWRAARSCFSNEMQEANAPAIETQAFYESAYWGYRGTIHDAFGPVLLLAGATDFSVVERSEDRATVQVSYAEQWDKEIRLKRAQLRKEANGDWKVSEVYGKTRGSAPPRR